MHPSLTPAFNPPDSPPKMFCFSENGEILDFDNSDDHDDDDLPSVSEIVARSRRAQVQTRPAGPAIDLTCNADDNDTEVS